MRGVVAWFAQNHVAANLLMLVFVVGGLVTASTLKQEVFPEVRPDMITVSVVYPGAAPAEVESGVCVRIEEEIQGTEGIERLTSVASEGLGVVSAELVTGTDATRALDEIKALIDALDTLPDEVEEPIVQQAVNKRQVIDVVVSARADERSLKTLGERVRDEITALPGITHADLSIARPYEITIEVSEASLRRFGLTFEQVANAIRRSSLDLPGGSVKTEGGEILLRSVGQAYTGRDFETLSVLTRRDGTRVRVSDVATVVDGFEDTGRSARFDGDAAVMVQVFRVGQQRALDVSAAVHRYVEQAQERLPGGVTLTPWNDDAAILKSRLDLLIRNGRTGFLLVFVILALFLRMRLAFWVSLGIPISFLAAIWMMPALDVSLNLISLFAFIVVLGLAVDDAIVVGESIHQRNERGEHGVRAAAEGTWEVMTPVVFAVLTTVAAFSPLLFLEGNMGKVFRVIPVIVIPVLCFSLVESLFVLPAHLAAEASIFAWLGAPARFVRRVFPAAGRAAHAVSDRWDRIQGGFDRGLSAFVGNAYEPTLRYALRARYLVLAIATATLFVTVGLVGGGWIRFTFFPPAKAEDVVALLTMPLGTPRERTEAALARVEDAVDTLRAEAEAEFGEGAFRHVLTSFGEQPYRSRQRQNAGGGSGALAGEHVGEVNIELAPFEDMPLDGVEIARRWRELVGQIPEAVELTFTSSLFSSGEPINVELASNRTQELQVVAEEVQAALAAFPGVYDITDTFRRGKGEIRLSVKPEAESLGISLSDLARQVRQAFHGEEAQRIQRGRDDVKVMVRLPQESRRSIGDLENLRIRAPGGVEVPLSTVADAEMGRGFSTIRRTDRRRVINVTADVDLERTNAGEVLAALAANELPRILADHPDVTYSFEGEQRQQTDTIGSLRRGFLVAMFVVFALLAIPLRSYTQPLIIMAVIPFGFVGAVLGHLLLRMDLTMLSMAGFVALSGVVVNDSLVLVDFVNRARREGYSLVDAVRRAGTQRFRAILLTSLSTFAGVTPLLLERSMQAQFLKPLAVSMGFGVMFATAVTLVLVPVAYFVLEDLHGLGQRLELGDAEPKEA